MADKNTIKNWFKTGLKPTQGQFWATWDSFWHKDEKIPITAIDDIENILADKADAEVLAHHMTDLTAHADLFGAKEDKTKRGAALGYAPLNEFTKLAIDYLNVVNDLVTGGESSLLTAEQGKLLQIQITAINTLLTSDNVNLDNVQEIVDAIETVQMSLSSILVNDLTTGGTTKALTAEMGKTLKGLIDGLVVPVATDTVYGTVKTDSPSAEPIVYLAETVDNLLSSKANTFTAIKLITGITYNPIIDDVATELLYEGTLPMDVTIPTNATMPFPVGTSFYTLATNTGVLSAIAAPGVTLKYKAGMSLSGVQNEIRKYTKQGINTWLVDGSIAATSAKLPYTAYINTVSGNNATASLGDATKPFSTDAAAYAALPTDDGNAWSFIFLCDNVTRVLGSTSFTRRIKYICYNTGTINFSNFTVSGVYKELYFDAPLCTLYHAGVTDYTNITTGSSKDSFFNVKKLWLESAFLLSNGHSLGSKFLIGTFYQRNSGNAFFTSGTIRIGLFDSTVGNIVANGTTIDISIDELSLNNNGHAIGLSSGKLIANPIKKFSGTGTFTTSSINNFDVTNLETSSGTNIVLNPVTWLKGKTATTFLGTLKGSPEYASNIINFNGRFTPASGVDAYGASVNIINSNVALAGTLIYSNSGWPSRTVVIKNSIFYQDTPQALFQGYGGTNVLTIEKHGKLYSNGNLGVDGVNVILVNKTPNEF